jgi:hypothetical protein
MTRFRVPFFRRRYCAADAGAVDMPHSGWYFVWPMEKLNVSSIVWFSIW